MKLLRLHGGGVAGVDDADHATLARYTWKLYRPSPSRTRCTQYAITRIKGRDVYLHLFLWRVVWQRARVPVVDHKDNDGLHCTRTNLCEATVGENNRRRGKLRNNTSGFKGVNWDQCCQKWRAKIAINGKRLHLGLFVDPQEAADAYDKAAQKHHGAFAVLNRGERDATPIRPIQAPGRREHDPAGIEPAIDQPRAARG